MKFLVIDDSATMRRIIVNSLQRIGHTDCVEAGDGVEALRVFTPDIGVIITDWNMPGMTGVDFVRALRERPDGKAVPVLMVTTRSIKQDIVQAVQAGVNNYIVKPFTPQILKEKIDALLSGQPAIVS
jgi:two-component system, chemotaxis family, chemotaxis protein CheY